MNNQLEHSNYKPKAERLMDQVREVLRYHHYAYKTEQSYVHWILRYIRFHNKQHPKELGRREIEAFLSDLAMNKNVAVSTQNLAFNAIIFLYKRVLHIEIEGNIRAVRSNKSARIPVVLTQQEISAILAKVSGISGLIIRLMYGSGLRISEAMRLRVNDFDFDRSNLTIHESKGGKDRNTLLSTSLHEPLQKQISKAHALHKADLKAGFGAVYLPNALARKYRNAPTEFGWQYVFPARSRSKDPRSGEIRRHHIHPSAVQKQLKKIAKELGIIKRVTPHILRHSFATHLLENGTNIRMVQSLLGHKDVKTTEIYTHVMDKKLDNIVSPLDQL